MGHRHHHCHHVGSGCLVMSIVLIALGILAMPVLGLSMCLSKEEEQHGIGAFLLIVGIILWIYIGFSN